MVDMSDSKSLAFGRGGSSPPIGTTYFFKFSIQHHNITLLLKYSNRCNYTSNRAFQVQDSL